MEIRKIDKEISRKGVRKNKMRKIKIILKIDDSKYNTIAIDEFGMDALTFNQAELWVSIKTYKSIN